MGLKVMVMSPLHNLGASVTSALIAQGLTFDNKTTTLLFTDADSRLPSYLGIEDVADPTRSVMQIVRLIDTGAIDDDDILEYAHQYVKNSYMLNVADPTLDEHDRIEVVQHIFNRVPTDVAIVDNTHDIDDEATADLLSASDALFIVTNMSPKGVERVKAWMDSPALKDFHNVFIIVVGYNESTMSLREFAKYMKTTANRVCKVHYNPWIQKCTINGQLQTILPLAKDWDPRVAALENDISEITQCINSVSVTRIKKGF